MEHQETTKTRGRGQTWAAAPYLNGDGIDHPEKISRGLSNTHDGTPGKCKLLTARVWMMM